MNHAVKFHKATSPASTEHTMNNPLIRKLENIADKARFDALFNYDGGPATADQRAYAKMVERAALQTIEQILMGIPDTEAWKYFLAYID